MDYLRKYLGTQPGENHPTGAETVERLCERVQSSTLLDDRRDAVRALKALSKKFRLEVGTQAMDILVNVFQNDRNDAEITGYTLETLCNVMSNEPLDEEDEPPSNVPGDLGAQFTEIFIKKHDNVALLLSLLEEYDFHVRWPTVKLLTVLLTNKCKDLQECILVSPMGVSKLMDLLSDSREIIRNDALLLLIQLTKGNANIQKIVAFENAFERLLDIIKDEGSSDGGIVVEDCLLLLLNLLKNNISNQNFFKEGSFIQRLAVFFDLDSSDQQSQGGWSAQKVTNIHLMLQLVRTMVSPNNPQQQTTTCQKTMNRCGLLQQMCTILMASGVPADVLTETINTVSEVIRGNPVNQEYFASVLAPSNPPRPAIVVLLMSMVNEKQPFVLRCAVLYCFQSFLFKNEIGQSQIVQTLLPTTADVNTITAGQLLCGGLFSADSLSNWFAAVAMLHAIMENTTQKEQLLRVQLATSLGNPPVSLLQQCCNMLAQGGKLQTRIGLLMLMCGWMSNCPIAVNHFLSNTANVPYLISQVSGSEGDDQESLIQGLCAFLLGICMLYNDDQSETFKKAALRQVIENRIGLEVFTDKLSQILKNENYTRAAKKPHLYHKQPNEVLFDYEFTRLYKTLESDVSQSMSSSNHTAEGMKKAASIQEHENIVDHYKELIKQQDKKLEVAVQELENYRLNHSVKEKEIEQLQDQVQQLKDQNALYKAKKGSQIIQNDVAQDEKKVEEVAELHLEIKTLKENLTQRDTQIEELKKGVSETGARSSVNDTEGEAKVSDEAGMTSSALDQLNADIDTLRKTLSEKEEEINQLKSQLAVSQKEIEEAKHKFEESSGTTAKNNSEEEKTINSIQEEKRLLQERLKKSNEENLKHLETIRKLDEEKLNAEKSTEDVKNDLETIKKEQDDLLVLLADQDAKIEQFKSKLKELGYVIDDDDEDDDDLDDDNTDETGAD